MQPEPGYLAARSVAERVRPHFAAHTAAAGTHGGRFYATPPDVGALTAMIDAAFWASLRREESYAPTISLAFLAPEQAVRPLTFADRLPLAPDVLARLAPAVKRPGIHLGVWPVEGELSLWGTTRTIPRFCFVLEVVAPGLLVIKHRRDEDSGKFVNVAVLEGDQVKVLDQGAASRSDCPAVLYPLFGFDLAGSSEDSFNALAQLAVSMRAHGRGGALLVVPENADAWQASIVQPIRYSVVPAFLELAELMKESGRDKHSVPQEAFYRSVETIAGLTAVDGATIITDQYAVLAFGAKIARGEGAARIERVVVTEPIEGNQPLVVHPSELGGT